MEVKKHHLSSPVEVTTTHLGIPLEYKSQCIEEIYKIGDQMNHKSNVKADMSEWYIFENNDVFNPLLDNIFTAINLFVPIEDKKFKYKMSNCWSARYKKGDYTVPHKHLPSHLSFVYNLKADKPSSPIVFNYSNFQLTPIDDLLIIFPSYLTHSVPKQLEETERICIAGNLSIEEIFNK